MLSFVPETVGDVGDMMDDAFESLADAHDAVVTKHKSGIVASVAAAMLFVASMGKLKQNLGNKALTGLLDIVSSALEDQNILVTFEVRD